MGKIKRGWYRSLTWFKTHVSPAVFAAVVALVVIGPLLLSGHGYADNGDFWHVTLQNGLQPIGASDAQYVTLHYHIMQHYNDTTTHFFGSQNLIVQVAIGLNKLFYSRTTFDIRFLGVLYLLLFAGAIALLTHALTLPQRRLRSYLIGLMLVFVFGDSAWTLGFTSFQAQPVTLVALLYAVALLLLLGRDPTTRRWWTYGGYVVATFVLVTSRPQTAVVAAGMLVASLGLLTVPKARRFLPIFVCFLLALPVAGYVTVQHQPQLFQESRHFQAYSTGVLRATDQPDKRVQQAGLSPQTALLRDEFYAPAHYTATLPSGPQLTHALRNRISTTWISTYYLRHLDQLWALLTVTGENQMITQEHGVGNTPRGQGTAPRTRIRYMTACSNILATFYPRRYAFNLMLAFALLIVFVTGVVNDRGTDRTESIIRFWLVCGLLLTLLLVPVTTLIGYGTVNLGQNLTLIPLCVSLLGVILVADALTNRLWRAYGEEGDGI